MSSITRRLVAVVTACSALAAANVAHAQVQTKSQIKCITSTNDTVSKVAKSQFGVQAKCLKAAAAGTLPMGQDIAACVTADTDGKVGSQVAKAATKDAKSCPPGLADFAYTSSATATTAGIDGARNTFDDIAALDTPGSILSSDSDPDGAKCQAAMTKSTAKVMLATLAEFRSCKKTRLGDGSVASSVQLWTQCFDAITTDGSGKIGAATSKLADTFAKKCAESSQAAVLPGDCAAAPDVAACIARVAKCRTCQTFNAADNLLRGCDQFDDGAINASCETATTCDDDDNDTYGTNCAAGNDCNDVNPNINPGAAETCNGIDDDCDFTVDDSPVDAGGSCGSNSVPPCTLGTNQCLSGVLECVGNVEPAMETCNGVDDDCNGTVDDSAPCDPGLACQSGLCLP